MFKEMNKYTLFQFDEVAYNKERKRQGYKELKE